MESCPECGARLECYGLARWSTGTWLYGCSRCDILWEEIGDSLTGRISRCGKSFQTLSEWKKDEEERKAETEKWLQKQKEQKALRAELKEKGFPEAVALSEELLNSLSEEQKQTLIKLTDLAKKEQELAREINARKPTSSGVLRLPNGSVVPCEDEDDWKVITMGLRSELKRVLEEIAQNLNKALNCGLAHLGIIQRQCTNYGVEL